MAVTLHQLPPSPNNMKVKLALNLKQIPHESVSIDMADRSALVELSGQPLSPVLVDDGKVVYDSYGILRYLDANWKDGPRLYASDREAQKEIEGWEAYARSELGECMGMVIGPIVSGNPDPAAFAQAKAKLGERLGKVEQALEGKQFLLGTETPTAADLTIASFAKQGFFDEPDLALHPVRQFFFDHVRLNDADFPNTRAWVDRCMQSWS